MAGIDSSKAMIQRGRTNNTPGNTVENLKNGLCVSVNDGVSVNYRDEEGGAVKGSVLLYDVYISMYNKETFFTGEKIVLRSMFGMSEEGLLICYKEVTLDSNDNEGFVNAISKGDFIKVSVKPKEFNLFKVGFKQGQEGATEDESFDSLSDFLATFWPCVQVTEGSTVQEKRANAKRKSAEDPRHIYFVEETEEDL